MKIKKFPFYKKPDAKDCDPTCQKSFQNFTEKASH